VSSDLPFYGLAHFPKGSIVRIVDSAALDHFARTWKFHHKLEPEQLGFAGQVATVEEVSMYHGGDILYVLKNVPGIWHQRLLERAS
jgi:hypothetical protein